LEDAEAKQWGSWPCVQIGEFVMVGGEQVNIGGLPLFLARTIFSDEDRYGLH
jgi:hypothetical protein